MAVCPGLPRWASTRNVIPIWILLKQETVSGSGISWAVCKSAPRSRQIIMPAPHHSHTHLTALFPGLPKWASTRKVPIWYNLDFTEARDSEWQWHQLGHMKVCTLLQTDNHISTPPLCFYRPGALPATQPTASSTEAPQHSDFSKKFHQVGPCVYVYRCVQQSYKTARSSCQHPAS